MKISRWMAAASALALTAAAYAAPKTFIIGAAGPADSRMATVESATSLETFTGKTNQVSGAVKADPKTRLGSGYIEIDPTSLDTGIAGRNGHLQGPQWLDTARYPRIRFTATRVKPLAGDKYEVAGKFTMKGVTRDITVPVTARYVAKSAATKKAGFTGDVLYLNTTFTVKLSDYGITISGPATGKVSDTVKIALTAYGAAA